MKPKKQKPITVKEEQDQIFNEARERIKKGDFYTEEEAKKILGL